MNLVVELFIATRLQLAQTTWHISMFCLQCFDAVGCAAEQEGHPACKNWCGYVSGWRCRFAYGPADATATHYLLLQ